MIVDHLCIGNEPVVEIGPGSGQVTRHLIDKVKYLYGVEVDGALAQLMRERGIRRLVVMEEDELIGVITTNDLVRNMKRSVDELAMKFYMMDLY